jgi:hypothetical protein
VHYGSDVRGGSQRSKELGDMTTSNDNSTSAEDVTLQEFEAMAKRGRIHMAVEDTVEPSKADLSMAKSPLDFGRLYGYSEDDIACFYLKRRGGRTDIAHEEYVCDLKCANFPPSKPSAAK